MTAAIPDLIQGLRAGRDLTYDEAGHIMSEMLSGRTTDGQNAEILSGLAGKGETDDELLGMLDRMQDFAVRVEARVEGGGGGAAPAIDMCGTGGDGLRTFNVSTAASFVVAAAGGRVAKHGNRSSSGASGSADMFEFLGYDLGQGPEQVASVLERYGICFMFAQRFHPAMRHVAAARRRLPAGTATAFNILGPLSNPAGVGSQLVGVSSAGYLRRLPSMLARRAGGREGRGGRGRGPGGSTVMAVRSENGLDEFSTAAPNRVCTVRDGGDPVETLVDPVSVGLHDSELREIQVDTADEAIGAFVGALGGTAGRAVTETVALNAAGGLVVSRIAGDIGEGVRMALEAIDGGRAFSLLERFVAGTGGDAGMLREIADGAGRRRAPR